jgi:hypothetical protein
MLRAVLSTLKNDKVRVKNVKTGFKIKKIDTQRCQRYNEILNV